MNASARRSPPSENPLSRASRCGQLRSILAALGSVGGRNGTCSNTKYKSQSTCTSHSAVWTPANHSTWNGCVTDRDQNFDTTNDAPVASATLYPTEQYASCPVSTIGLTNNWTTLSDKITPCSRSATPTRRSACSSAGSR